jgi:hypothetical protein
MIVAKTADHYRTKAQRARYRAAIMDDLHLRTVWLAIADQFDYLAALAERHAPSPAPPK